MPPPAAQRRLRGYVCRVVSTTRMRDMRAVRYDAFAEPPALATVAEPRCPPKGVVVEVVATGLCRSDWHGWMGHDPAIKLPHVPGHEFSGTVAQVGTEVTRWAVG